MKNPAPKAAQNCVGRPAGTAFDFTIRPCRERERRGGRQGGREKGREGEDGGSSVERRNE